jgi:hypothetical protein
MALGIPIISTFDGSGVSKAKQEFKQLEGVGAKAGFAIKKAFLPAVAVLGAMGVALVDATKGAIEDAKAQELLATQLRKSTGATDAQIASVEKFVSSMGSVRAVADDEVRPALAQLVRATSDVTRAQLLFKTAQDVSAATGKGLSTVVMALSKAEQGQYTALKKLGIPMGENTQALMDQATESRKTMKAQMEYDNALASGSSKEAAKALEKLKEAQERLNGVTLEGADYIKDLDKSFGGAGETAANTTAGQFAKMKIALDETKESIGAALLPAVQALLPFLNNLATWAQDNPQYIIAAGVALAAVAAAIVAINVAMMLNPIGLITAGIVVLVASLVGAYKKFDGFKKIVDLLFGAIKFWITNVTIPAVEALVGVFKTVFNTIAKLWNSTIGKIGFEVPDWIPKIGGKKFEVPNIPMLANGGIVNQATLAVIGEAGPEAVVPLDRMREFGMGGGGINVTVHAGLMSSPDQVGQQIIEAIQKAQRRSGVVFAPA